MNTIGGGKVLILIVLEVSLWDMEIERVASQTAPVLNEQ